MKRVFRAAESELPEGYNGESVRHAFVMTEQSRGKMYGCLPAFWQTSVRLKSSGVWQMRQMAIRVRRTAGLAIPAMQIMKGKG